MVSKNQWGALQFSGGSSSGTAAHNSALNFGTSDFSIDLNVSYSSLTNSVIASKLDTSGWQLGVNNTGKVTFVFNALTYEFSANIDDDTFHEIHIDIDRSASLVTIYIDGSIDGTLDISGQGSVDNTSSLVLGGSGANPFDGKLSEFRLSNRRRVTKAYRVDEIQLRDDNWTVALYHFNEGQDGATVAYDSSTTRNHMTLVGSNFIEGAKVSNPITVIRDRLWLAIDASADLTRFLDARLPSVSSSRSFDGKYRWRKGDPIPDSYTQSNTPALIVAPTALPDMEIETVQFHNVRVPIVIQGVLFHKELEDLSQFWFLTLKAIFSMYRATTTSGRFNWVAIQHMTPRGPSFETQQQQNDTLFSEFEDTLLFDVNYDFFSG